MEVYLREKHVCEGKKLEKNKYKFTILYTKFGNQNAINQVLHLQIWVCFCIFELGGFDGIRKVKNFTFFKGSLLDVMIKIVGFWEIFGYPIRKDSNPVNSYRKDFLEK